MTAAPMPPFRNAAATRPTPPQSLRRPDDLDPNDGGGERQQNEPAVAVDPTDPTQVVASWNEYCTSDLVGGFLGLGFSTDSGETWVNSLTPGYPEDTSTEGQQSPLFGKQAVGSDPLLAFNSDGDLYTAGIAFNEAKPQDSVVYVTTWAGHPAGGLPYDYQRTAVVGKGGTPSTRGGAVHRQADDGGRPHGDAVQRQRLRVLVSIRRAADARRSSSAARPTEARRSRMTSRCRLARTSRGATSQSRPTATSTSSGEPVTRPAPPTAKGWVSPGPRTAAARSPRPAQVGSFRRYFPFDTAHATAATALTCARANSCSRASRSSLG